MKRYRPYILTAFVFCLLFLVSQVLPVPMTYFGFEDTTIGERTNSDRTVIQFYTFFVGLIIWMTIINNLPSLKSIFSTIWERIYISWLVIILVYAANYLTYVLVDTDGFCIYYDWKDNYGFPLAFGAIILTSILSWTVHKLLTMNDEKIEINTTHNTNYKNRA
jgi:hypothetical protein